MKYQITSDPTAWQTDVFFSPTLVGYTLMIDSHSAYEPVYVVAWPVVKYEVKSLNYGQARVSIVFEEGREVVSYVQEGSRLFIVLQ